MWHTAEIYTPITTDIVQRFCSHGKMIPGEIRSSEGKKLKCWINVNHAKDGVTLWTYPVRKADYNATLIYARINFMKLLHEENFVTVASERHNNACFGAFARLMQEHFPELPSDITIWTVSRLDYCINTFTPYNNEYVKLGNKAKLYRNTYVKNSKGGSVYRGNASYTLNFYNKLSEMLDDIGTRQDISAIQKAQYLWDAMGIFRLEVQCRATKLKCVKQNYGLPSKTLDQLCRDDIAQDILGWALLTSVGSEPYLRRSVAIEKIKHMKGQQAKKERMVKLINDITRGVNISEVQKRYEKHDIMKKQTFNNYIKALKDANINPVTIPDSWELQHNVSTDGLDSIYDLYLNALVKEFGQPTT